MGIKHLDAYLTERKHLQTLPLAVLADTRLGIDASYYLSIILESPSSREPLLAATGGLPLALSTRIESDLRVLEKHRIKPVFVFPGLLPAKRPRPNGHEYMEPCRERKEAWAKYESGQEEQAQKLFESRGCISQWDLWRSVLRIFRHRNVEFLVAPYTAWAQLIYLQRHPKSYIHAIYGPTETLLYHGVDKLITNIEFSAPTPTFQYVSKKSLLNDLNLSEEQFLDTSLLVGCDHLPTFPPTHEQNLKSFVDMVKYYKSGHAAVNAFLEHPGVKQASYLEAFLRVRSMVKFSLVISSEGTVTSLPLALSSTTHPPPHHIHHTTPSDIPADLHEIFTNRLPDEIYFYLSRGLIGPQVLVWLTTGQINEAPPLDNGETNEYRRFVKEVVTEGATGPRATALALVSSVINNFWSNRRVAGVFWFDSPGSQKPIMHNSNQTTQLAERVAAWNVPSIVVEEELRRQNSATIDFALCLGATSSEKLASRTRTKTALGSVRQLDKKDEVVANVIWRFLELRGFLLNSHTHSSLARAMYSAITKTTRINDKFQDPLYLFLELVRAGVLHGNLWSQRAYSGGPSFGVEEEKKCMLLVMRVLSIVPLSFKSEPWSAPLSRELLVFNSFVRSLSRALRTLIEVTALNMLVRGDARRQRDDLLDISLSLPFQTDVNTGFGVLAKVYLDALTHLNGGQCVRDANAEGVLDRKEMALEICEETFTGVKYPKMEVERGFRFWDTALAAMRSLHAENEVLPELAEAFEHAEVWLRPMRP